MRLLTTGTTVLLDALLLAAALMGLEALLSRLTQLEGRIVHLEIAARERRRKEGLDIA